MTDDVTVNICISRKTDGFSVANDLIEKEKNRSFSQQPIDNVFILIVKYCGWIVWLSY